VKRRDAARGLRDGVPEVNLVDGEALLERFEELKLGLVPKTVYEIDESFFDEFCC
jgi:restriction system protein